MKRIVLICCIAQSGAFSGFFEPLALGRGYCEETNPTVIKEAVKETFIEESIAEVEEVGETIKRETIEVISTIEKERRAEGDPVDPKLLKQVKREALSAAQELVDTAEEAKESAEIERRALQALQRSQAFSNSAIRVKTKGGVLTIEGTVEYQEQKYLAEELLRDIPSVSHIENKLRISSEDAQKPLLSTSTSDLRLSMAVKGSLLLDKRVSGLRIDVDVSDGKVYLEGEVRNQAQRLLVEEVVRSVDGLVSVQNNLIVREGGEEPPPLFYVLTAGWVGMLLKFSWLALATVIALFVFLNLKNRRKRLQ